MPDYNALLKQYQSQTSPAPTTGGAGTTVGQALDTPDAQSLSPFADAERVQAERDNASGSPSLLGGIAQAGGFMLTKTLAGVTAPGQFIEGGLKYLEDLNLTHQDFRLSDFWTSASQQSARVMDSRNLGELAQNSLAGADLLKELPGGVGDFFKQDTTLAKTTSFVLGLGVDIVTDPLTYLTGGTTKAAELLATGATKLARGGLEVGVKTGLTTAARADELAPRYGSILHNGLLTFGGSVVPQTIALGAKDLVAARIGKYQALVNAATATDATRNKAAGLLTWLVGKTSTADEQTKQAIGAYQSLMNNLPTEMTLSSRTGDLAFSKLTGTRRTDAQQALRQLVQSQVTDPARAGQLQAVLTTPVKQGGFGLDAVDLQRLVGGYRQASLRLGNFGMESGMAQGLLADHLKRSYALFQVDSPDVFNAQLAHMDHENLPPEFWLNQGEVANRLRGMLGNKNSGTAGFNTNPSVVSSVPTVSVPGVKPAASNTGLGIPGSQVQGGYTAFGQPTATVSKTLTSATGNTADLERAIGNLQKAKAKLGPKDPKLATVQAKIDDLQAKLGVNTDVGMSQDTRDRLTGQAMSMQDTIGRAGADSKIGQQLQAKQQPLFDRLDANTPENAGIPMDATISPKGITAQPGNSASAANPFTLTQNAAVAQSQLIMKNSIQNLGFVPSAPRLAKPEMEDFISKLGTWWGEDPHLAPHLIGLTDGNVVADAARIGMANPAQYTKDPAALIAAARKKTAADIGDFVDQHGKSLGWDDKKIAAVAENTINSVVHVAGGAELAAAVRNGRGDLAAALDKNAALVKTLQSVTGIDSDTFASRELIDPYRQRFGEIKEFSPAAVIQAKEQARAISQHRLFQTLVDQNVARDDVLPIEKPGWVQLKGEQYGPADGKYIQFGNYTALKLAMNDADNLNLPKFVTGVTSMLKRNLLVYDVSSAVSQWLGNLDFLSAAGMHPLGFNLRDSGMRWGRAINSLVRFDGDYNEAVNAGLDVQMHALDDSTLKDLRDNIVRASIDQSTGKTDSVLTRMAHAWTDTIKRTQAGIGNLASTAKRGLNDPNLSEDARQNLVNAANAQERLALTAINPSSMFGLPDQATRMFAFQRGKDKMLSELVAANPEMKPYLKGSGVDFDRWLKEAEANHNTAQAALATQQPAGWKGNVQSWAQPVTTPFDPSSITTLRNAYQQGLQDSARVANEVALNYHDVPLLAEALSRSGVVPFIKFSWKSNGRLMDWFAEKPAIYAKYARLQREAGAAFVGDADDREQFQQGLPEAVRNGMNIPLPIHDSLGRQITLDLSRWIPYAAYAQAASGTPNTMAEGGEGGRSPALTDMFGSPIMDFLANTYDGMNRAKTNGQDWAAVVAQNVASSFLPSSVLPGSRQMTQLATSIRQSVLGETTSGGNYMPQGQFVGSPSAGITDQGLQSMVDYAQLPQNAAAALSPQPGSPTGDKYLPSNIRPTKSPESTLTAFVVPGYGVASDAPRALIAAQNRAQAELAQLTTQIRAVAAQAGNQQLNPQQLQTIAGYQQRQAYLQQQLGTMANKLTQPRATTLGN